MEQAIFAQLWGGPELYVRQKSNLGSDPVQQRGWAGSLLPVSSGAVLRRGRLPLWTRFSACIPGLQRTGCFAPSRSACTRWQKQDAEKGSLEKRTSFFLILGMQLKDTAFAPIYRIFLISLSLCDIQLARNHAQGNLLLLSIQVVA